MENGTTTNSNPPPPKKKTKQVHVRVGVGVLVQDPLNPGKIFAGTRKGSHGAGSLALPGGHLEMMETWKSCAQREVKEEMNLDLDLTSIHFAHVTNDIMESEDKHYVTIFMMGTCQEGSSTVPENMEPDKCEGWKSYSWKELQDILNAGTPQLFGPLAHLVEDSPASVKTFLGEE